MKNKPSEFMRKDLSDFFFYCKSLGIKNICDVDLINIYDRNRLEYAANFLYCIKLIDSQGELSQLGKKVSVVPLDIKLSLCLNLSFMREFNCSKEMIIIGKFN